MGSRGPVPKRAQRARSAMTADGKRLRQLPDDAGAIFRRMVRDIAGLTPADVALVEDTARWVAVAKESYRQLREDAEAQTERQAGDLALTVTDTAHGDGTESRKNPLLIVLRTASEQIRANTRELGATPLARARLPEPETEQLSLADILFADVDAANHE